jgi:hypothetical protein
MRMVKLPHEVFLECNGPLRRFLADTEVALTLMLKWLRALYLFDERP